MNQEIQATVLSSVNTIKSLRLGWMGVLQNTSDYLLSDLTIPGTHDTGTWKINAGNSAKCQDLSLKDQLDLGIRFIDIRLVPYHNSDKNIGDLAIYHSHEPGNVWFSDVVDVCRDFLTANGTETIIMSIKNENEVNDLTFNTALDVFLTGEKQTNSTVDLFYTSNAVPKLSDAAGKIVLFRRYTGSTKGIDAVTDWPHDEKTSVPTQNNMMIQDVFRMKYANQGDVKWSDHILPFLTDAISNNLLSWYINFTSTSGGGYPSTFSKEINPLFQTWLETKMDELKTSNNRIRLGTIIMDFPTSRMIDALISMNINHSSGMVHQNLKYKFKLSNNTAYIGKCYQPGDAGTTWSYAQKYTDQTFQKVVSHTLVKIDGVDSSFIHFGDTVRILSTEFTNDSYIYLENYGCKSEGINLFYDNIEGDYQNDPRTVEWIIEPGLNSTKHTGDFVEIGDPIRFHSLFKRDAKECYLAAATDSYLGVQPLNHADIVEGGYDWSLE
ncbi:1-phosphatidylinositol phosphodiesterase precursor [compost metagenome]